MRLNERFAREAQLGDLQALYPRIARGDGQNLCSVRPGNQDSSGAGEIVSALSVGGFHTLLTTPLLARPLTGVSLEQGFIPARVCRWLAALRVARRRLNTQDAP
jgi:hypothetical protein